MALSLSQSEKQSSEVQVWGRQCGVCSSVVPNSLVRIRLASEILHDPSRAYAFCFRPGSSPVSARLCIFINLGFEVRKVLLQFPSNNHSLRSQSCEAEAVKLEFHSSDNPLLISRTMEVPSFLNYRLQWKPWNILPECYQQAFHSYVV